MSSMSIHLEHGFTPDGRYHVITSPDIEGLLVIGDTLEEAEQEALILIREIRRIQGHAAEAIKTVELEEVAA